MNSQDEKDTGIKSEDENLKLSYTEKVFSFSFFESFNFSRNYNSESNKTNTVLLSFLNKVIQRNNKNCVP